MHGYLPANCLLRSSRPYSVIALNNIEDKQQNQMSLKGGLNVIRKHKQVKGDGREREMKATRKKLGRRGAKLGYYHL